MAPVLNDWLVNYAFHLPSSLIIVAVTLDAACGDPAWLPHPVRLIGRMIAAGDRYLHTGRRRADLVSGALLSIVIIAATVLATWAVIAIGQTLRPYAG
ncbi:MAG: cobalamin biosynthesis protein, partial [Candidatus Binataceae bacterium]